MDGVCMLGDRWSDWVGTSTPNTYFINLLNNLGELTGRMPDIRVGANSEDRTFFDKSVKVRSSTVRVSHSKIMNFDVFWPLLCAQKGGDCDISSIQFGDSVSRSEYRAGRRRILRLVQMVACWSGFPSLTLFFREPKHVAFIPGTKVIWGVNQLSSNVTNAVAMAKSIVKAFSVDGPAHRAGVSLAALQIGNEADLYVGHGFRPKSWNISAYVGEYVKVRYFFLFFLKADMTMNEGGRVLLARLSRQQRSSPTPALAFGLVHFAHP